MTVEADVTLLQDRDQRAEHDLRFQVDGEAASGALKRGRTSRSCCPAPQAAQGINCSQGSSNPGQVVAVNGNLPYSNIIADGASTTLSHSQNANPATFENVSELQVNTSSFSAQYGIGGIIFNQVSKNGTNKFHGTGYDFIQNDMFTAHPYFDTQTDSVPSLQQLRRVDRWPDSEEQDVLLLQL